MDSDTTIQLIALIVLLFLSGFFSSAETALTTCNRLRIKTLADDNNKSAKILWKVIENPGKMLSCILVGNNIVNISASSLATIFVQNQFGNWAVSIATGVLTLLVLIFGEITPKTLASIHADSMALGYAPIIYGLIWIFTPIIFITNGISTLLLKLLRVDSSKKGTSYTETELRTIMEVSEEEGVIEEGEKKLINNVFDFGDRQAKDIMVPRIDMCMVSVESTYEEVLDTFKKERYTRLPVYDEEDNVIGVINIKDLLLYNASEAFNLRDYLRPVFFTYEYKDLTELMLQIKKCSVNIIIVLDEYGATSGLITMEDILEEIVGDIRDEYDYDEEEIITKITDNEYLIDGLISLDDLNDALDLQLSSDSYDSLGGFIIEKLDRLAEANDKVEHENLIFKVDKMDNKRIDKVRLSIKEKLAEE